MSYDQADSKFPRLISPIDAARTAQGGLAVLGDENPNGATAADVDVADAALGAIGITPTGVLWKKIAMTTGTQWAPLVPNSSGDAFLLAFEVDATGAASASAVWTADVACEIASVWLEGMAAVDTPGTLALATTAGAYIATSAWTIDAGVGVIVNPTTVVPAARGMAVGQTLTVTYTKNDNADVSGRVWVLLRPTIPAIS